jgi:hypothetical protein
VIGHIKKGTASLDISFEFAHSRLQVSAFTLLWLQNLRQM